MKLTLTYIKTLTLLALLALPAFTREARAQVAVSAKIDSSQIFIGQRVGITLEVAADKGQAIELPRYDSLQQIVPGLELVKTCDADTGYLNEGKRVVISQKYLITSFDTALYYIPPMRVKVGGKTYEAKSLALKVCTFDIDTLHVDSIYGMKAEMAPPFCWDDWSLILWLSILTALVTVALAYVIIRLIENKPIIKRIRLKPRVAPHKAAMREIETIKQDKVWQSEDSKEYYTRLTDTLRQYIKDRYGFNAKEMTSDEIIASLQTFNDPAAIKELTELFQTADLVKFAKYSTHINENDRNLLLAIDYINSTKEEETEPKRKAPEEVVVVEQSSRNARILMTISVAIASALLLALVGYTIYRTVMLAM